MPRATVKSKDANPDYVRMYFDHQYERIEKLESHSLNISNIVLTISAVIITFGFGNRQSFGSVLILFLPAIIIILNISSILYVNDRSRWIAQHQKRAKRILEIYVPELYKLDAEVVAPPKKWAIHRKTIQNLMHYLLVLIGTILLVLFALDVIGVSLV
jgi:hypothetical protein